MMKTKTICLLLALVAAPALAVDIWMDVDTSLSEVPVNIFPLTDDGDFKTREVALTFDQAGMDLVWNFVTTAGAFTQTAVTPTEAGAGVYDWVNQGKGFYTIEIPASGGASINNDTEGHGWFSGYCTGVLPWRGPIIGFRLKAKNDSLINDATAFLDSSAIQTAAEAGLTAYGGAKEATLGVAGAGLTAVPYNAAWDAEIQSEVDDALRAIFLHQIFETAYNPAAKPGSASGLLNILFENDGGVPRFTANSLEQGPAGYLTAQQTRDAMKLAPTAGAPAAGSVDAELDAIYEEITGGVIKP